MLFKRFYNDGLAQASYMIGCVQSGEAIIIDANRDLGQYREAAASEKLRITHVTETHIHADFISGSKELARICGAQLLLSGEGGEDWQYAFAQEAGATLLEDGDHFMVGNIRFDVMHTPGHTPEHLTFVVTDSTAAAGPWGLLTGDFVFVGDVGRPDLLEKAAGQTGTMESGARELFNSLERFRAFPDHLQVWPGHGAGSACGKALGAVPSSTVGYERIANWGVGTLNEQEFISMVLEGQPEPPRYFAEMKRVNREGPPDAGSGTRPRKLFANDLDALRADNALIVDVRSAKSFAAQHIPRTLNIPLGSSFMTWAGSLLPYDEDIYLLVDRDCDDCEATALANLKLIGLDKVAGTFDSGVFGEWGVEDAAPGNVAECDVEDVARAMLETDAVVVDVRKRNEWQAGHMPGEGVRNIPLQELAQRLDELPRDKKIVVHCQGGGRAAIAASLLKANGFTDVSNLSGGFGAWQEAGKPVARGAEVKNQ